MDGKFLGKRLMDCKNHLTLRSITIKPLLKCNANCAFCKERRNHYKEREGLPNLSYEQWEMILKSSTSLGVETVNISGGEPTLYNHLINIVEYCKTISVKVHLKSNGILIDSNLAKELANAGLDSCTISIYSNDEAVHDKMKLVKGSHRAAVKAIDNILNVGIKANIQTILTNSLMKCLDGYLKWVAQLSINTLFISYLEGKDSLGRPTETEISDFVKNIIPRCKSVLSQTLDILPEVLRENICSLDNIFNFKNICYDEISNGIYNEASFKSCGRNHSMALLLANGEIHPCNAIEYFHEPIVGNLFVQTLADAWYSQKWKKVRVYGLNGICQLCPMNRHTFIKFNNENNITPFYC